MIERKSVLLRNITRIQHLFSEALKFSIKIIGEWSLEKKTKEK